MLKSISDKLEQIKNTLQTRSRPSRLKMLNTVLEKGGDAELFMQRARIYLAQDDPLHAIDDYSQAINKDPCFVQAYIERGLCLFSQGRNKQALADLDRAIELDESNVFALESRSSILANLDKLDMAIQDLSAIISLAPSAAAYEARGLAYEHANLFADAVSDYSKAICLDPSLTSAHLNLGDALSKSGDYKKSVNAYSSVIKLDPSCGHAWLYRATAYYNLTDYDLAEQDIDRAVDLCPENADAWSSRGWIMYCKGNFTEAEKSMRRALAITPDSQEALIGLSTVLATTPCPSTAEASRANEALKIAETAVQHVDEPNWRLLSALAAALARIGKYDEAVRLQESVIEKTPQNQSERGKSKLECYLTGKPFIFETPK